MVGEVSPSRPVGGSKGVGSTGIVSVGDEAPHRRVRHHSEVPVDEHSASDVPSIGSSSPNMRISERSNSKNLLSSSSKSGSTSDITLAAAAAAAAASPSRASEDDFNTIHMKRLRETYSYFQRIREDMKLDDDDDDDNDNDNKANLGRDSMRSGVEPSKKLRKASAAWDVLGSMTKAGGFSSGATGRRTFANTVLMATKGKRTHKQELVSGVKRRACLKIFLHAKPALLTLVLLVKCL